WKDENTSLSSSKQKPASSLPQAQPPQRLSARSTHSPHHCHFSSTPARQSHQQLHLSVFPSFPADSVAHGVVGPEAQDDDVEADEAEDDGVEGVGGTSGPRKDERGWRCGYGCDDERDVVWPLRTLLRRSCAICWCCCCCCCGLW